MTEEERNRHYRYVAVELPLEVCQWFDDLVEEGEYPDDMFEEFLARIVLERFRAAKPEATTPGHLWYERQPPMEL